MQTVYFFRLLGTRMWAMALTQRAAENHQGYFGSMAAITFSRLLQDQGFNSTIKKSAIERGNPLFRVIVKFDCDEDEDLFILKVSGGLVLDS